MEVKDQNVQTNTLEMKGQNTQTEIVKDQQVQAESTAQQLVASSPSPKQQGIIKTASVALFVGDIFSSMHE